MARFIAIVAFFHIAEGIRARNGTGADDPFIGGAGKPEVRTFDEFIQSFGRAYESGSKEYARRARLFEESLSRIDSKNSRANRPWTAGVHPFMDWTAAEQEQWLFGYKPSSSAARRTASRAAPTLLSSLQSGAGEEAAVRVYGGAGDSFEAEGPRVRDQGVRCGSCWAFASVEAVESQLIKQDKAWRRRQLSPQALLDCVANDEHCGGKGGCDGATGELAFDFMQRVGVPLEEDLRYRPSRTGKCPMEGRPEQWNRIRLSGWRTLPSNLAQPLMQALVHDGPAVVTADARTWVDYDSGVFEGCAGDAQLNHALLAKGYGHEKGTRYWLLQNSWGVRWGEHGNMRLFRHDDEDSYCGTDYHPQEGVGCDGGPKQVSVCGNCGILFDSVVPQGAAMVSAEEGVAATKSHLGSEVADLSRSLSDDD